MHTTTANIVKYKDIYVGYIDVFHKDKIWCASHNTSWKIGEGTLESKGILDTQSTGYYWQIFNRIFFPLPFFMSFVKLRLYELMQIRWVRLWYGIGIELAAWGA